MNVISNPDLRRLCDRLAVVLRKKTMRCPSLITQPCFRLNIFPILFLVSFTGSLQAQEKLSISGRVVDANTNEPLPYASVVLKNTTIGTTANEQGMFMLHIPAEVGIAMLQVSMLGYETHEMQVRMDGHHALVRLKSAPMMMKEVVVEDLSAKEILKRAFQNKRKNYPSVPFQFEGYYREVQRADGKNVSFVEAFALVDDEGYTKSSSQKYFLKQLRLAESYSHPVAPFWEKKNLLIAFLNQNFVKYNRTYRQYKVSRKEDVILDGVLVYVLTVDKKWALWPSQVYIRSDNYAIIKTEEDFSVDRNNPMRWKVLDNPMMESYPQRKTLQINYRLVDGKYYPENYRMHFKNIYTDVIQKKEVLTFEIFQQFVITKLYINDLKPVDHREAMSEDISLKKIVKPQDSTFWNNSPIKDTPADSLIRKDLFEKSRFVN